VEVTQELVDIPVQKQIIPWVREVVTTIQG
jgi:hypothetical protein